MIVSRDDNVNDNVGENDEIGVPSNSRNLIKFTYYKGSIGFPTDKVNMALEFLDQQM